VAIICPAGILPTSTEADDWYIRHSRYGYSLRQKSRRRHARRKRRVWPKLPTLAVWTRPSEWTGFFDYASWNHSAMLFTAHQYNTSPYFTPADYDLAAPNNTFMTSEGNLITPTGFQLFVWQRLTWVKWGWFYNKHHYDIFHFPPIIAGISSAWQEWSPPPITNPSWSMSGPISFTLSPGFSSNGASILISVIPPPFPKTTSAPSIDLYDSWSSGVLQYTDQVPAARWQAQLRGVTAGQTWGIVARQVRGGGDTQGPSRFGIATVTVTA
jgi:hypothetical protein